MLGAHEEVSRLAALGATSQATGFEVATAKLIEHLGDDPARDGLEKTPARYLKAMRELCCGYKVDVDEILSAKFESSLNQAVVVPNIEFYSLCEHHLLPFFGVVHIFYIPNGVVLGLSKFARVVDAFARRLQMQERMTEQIGTTIEESLHPTALGVVVKARHLCMASRGVSKQNASFTTSYLTGAARDDSRVRNELFSLIDQSRNPA